jgi:hypothetical protein
LYYWYSEKPTATTAHFGGTLNVDGEQYMAYFFRNVPGFLKIGYYWGNGSADGPKVSTGFRPALTWIKNTDVANWVMHDAHRDIYNPQTHFIYSNATNVEYGGTGLDVDLLSDGFKPRNANTILNANGHRYIYMAWAEMPYPFCNAF